MNLDHEDLLDLQGLREKVVHKEKEDLLVPLDHLDLLGHREQPGLLDLMDHQGQPGLLDQLDLPENVEALENRASLVNLD